MILIEAAAKAAKTSALSSRKIDKYEYLTGKEIRVTVQVKFTYFPLGKLRKTNKNERISRKKANKRS